MCAVTGRIVGAVWMDRMDKLEHEPLSDRVYRRLRTELAGGQFSPGDKIKISDLADRFGVSATPVREAINRLVSSGALEYRPNYSVLVPQLNHDAIQEIALIRCQLEGLAAEKAVENSSPEDAEAFEKLQDAEDKARSKKNYTEVLRINQKFHKRIISLAKMPIASEIAETLWTRSGPALTRISRQAVYGIPPDKLPHRAFITALQKGDPEMARQAIVDDINRATQLVLEELDAEEVARGGSSTDPELHTDLVTDATG